MELYSVAAGLGIAVAIGKLVASGDDGHGYANWFTLPLVFALLATLIPFYHGALRHLDTEWVHAEFGVPSWLMLVDFLILFMEACVLFAMAQFVSDPPPFGWALVLLLVIDCAWALTFILGMWQHKRPRERRLATLGASFVHFVRRVTQDETAPAGATELNWLWVNLVTIPILALTLLVCSWIGIGPLALSVVIAVGAVVRSVCDYRKSWQFYFPR